MVGPGAVALAAGAHRQPAERRPEDREGGLNRLVTGRRRAARRLRIPAESLLAELLCAKGRWRGGLVLAREAWQGARSASQALPLVYEDLLVRYSLSLNWAGEWEALAAALDEYEADYPSRLLLSGGILHFNEGPRPGPAGAHAGGNCRTRSRRRRSHHCRSLGIAALRPFRRSLRRVRSGSPAGG